MKDTIKRAWLYSHIDAPEDTHGVLKGQEKELYDYAGQMGFAIAGSSSDLGGVADTNRPGLAAMTAAAKDGGFDVLLVTGISRLGRNMERTNGLMRQLGEMGVNVYSPIAGRIAPEPAVNEPQMGGMSHA
jgi:DNA invertase Pin-like site-specific DNA recombinase